MPNNTSKRLPPPAKKISRPRPCLGGSLPHTNLSPHDYTPGTREAQVGSVSATWVGEVVWDGANCVFPAHSGPTVKV